jgi:hypothetical protein
MPLSGEMKGQVEQVSGVSSSAGKHIVKRLEKKKNSAAMHAHPVRSKILFCLDWRCQLLKFTRGENSDLYGPVYFSAGYPYGVDILLGSEYSKAKHQFSEAHLSYPVLPFNTWTSRMGEIWTGRTPRRAWKDMWWRERGWSVPLSMVYRPVFVLPSMIHTKIVPYTTLKCT